MNLNGKVKVTETEVKLFLLLRAISLPNFIKIRENFSGEEDGRKKKYNPAKSIAFTIEMVNANKVFSYFGCSSRQYTKIS